MVVWSGAVATLAVAKVARDSFSVFPLAGFWEVLETQAFGAGVEVRVGCAGVDGWLGVGRGGADDVRDGFSSSRDRPGMVGFLCGRARGMARGRCFAARERCCRFVFLFRWSEGRACVVRYAAPAVSYAQPMAGLPSVGGYGGFGGAIGGFGGFGGYGQTIGAGYGRPVPAGRAGRGVRLVCGARVGKRMVGKRGSGRLLRGFRVGAVRVGSRREALYFESNLLRGGVFLFAPACACGVEVSYGGAYGGYGGARVTYGGAAYGGSHRRGSLLCRSVSQR